jgi:hypothetical protein
MEDIVYIILAIVWLVISVLGGKKKKQAPQQQSRPARQPYEEKTAPPPGSEIEDMLEEFFGKSSKAPEAEPTAEQEPEEVYAHEEQVYDFENTQYDSLETIEQQDYSKYESKFSIDKDYSFSAVSPEGSMDEILRRYRESDEKAQEEDAKLAVVDLDMGQAVTSTFHFDPRMAVIYSAILNRKYE